MFLYTKWLELNIDARHKVASVFHIVKRHPTHVDSNVIVSDGYDIKEVEAALTVDALQDYLKTNVTDMAILWDAMLAKMDGREVILLKEEEITFAPMNVPPPKPALPATKKRGRPFKTGHGKA